MAGIYCIDTSALIESWSNNYRPRSFPNFWARMEAGINDGVLISPMIVCEELKRKEDELYKWAFEREKLFLPLTVEIQEAQKQIVNQFPKLVNEAKQRSLCDPWVIAVAQIKSCPVVTQEEFGSPQKPRIPDVCKALGIGCIKVADLIETLDWSF